MMLVDLVGVDHISVAIGHAMAFVGIAALVAITSSGEYCMLDMHTILRLGIEQKSIDCEH